MVMIVKDDVFLNLIGCPVTPPSSVHLLRCTSRRPRWPSPSASAPPSPWACSTCRRFTSSSSTPSRTSPNANAASRPSSPPPPWPASCRSWRPSGPTARWRRSCARAWRPAVSGPRGFLPSTFSSDRILTLVITQPTFYTLHDFFCVTPSVRLMGLFRTRQARLHSVRQPGAAGICISMTTELPGRWWVCNYRRTRPECLGRGAGVNTLLLQKQSSAHSVINSKKVFITKQQNQEFVFQKHDSTWRNRTGSVSVEKEWQN